MKLQTQSDNNFYEVSNLIKFLIISQAAPTVKLTENKIIIFCLFALSFPVFPAQFVLHFYGLPLFWRCYQMSLEALACRKCRGNFQRNLILSPLLFLLPLGYL